MNFTTIKTIQILIKYVFHQILNKPKQTIYIYLSVSNNLGWFFENERKFYFKKKSKKDNAA